ncbi:MAG: peptidase [Candidatus Zixiibacteriota bacterium]|nr:MAG: peptidase [candidate division Zixibacteria bacterium]
MNRRRMLMLFVDGLGLGSGDPAANPLAAHPDLWPTQAGAALDGWSWRPLDACLGVEGLPQSATGQTALLTGVNAPRLLGKHLPGFPSRRLVEILERDSLFVRLKAGGCQATFANAYRHPEDVNPAGRLSVTSHALRASGQTFRSLEHLRAGQAVCHDFTNRLLIERGYDAPEWTPEQAAAVLADLAREHHFTLYEHFLTDMAAHSGDGAEIARRVEELSRFVRAVRDRLRGAGVLVALTSDHGNIEEAGVRTHTRNPVPLMWPDGAGFPLDPLPEDLTGVVPWILRLLECPDPPRHP